MAEIKVTSLLVYPVKSCRGIELQEVACTPAGLALDRQWMVVSDAPNTRGKFLTQRQVPALALIGVDVQPDTVLRDDDVAAHPDAVLVLQSPAQPRELRIPIARSPSQRMLLDVTCWSWSGKAQDEGELPASWLTAALGRPARLVRFVGTLSSADDPAADPLRRPCDPTWRRGADGWHWPQPCGALCSLESAFASPAATCRPLSSPLAPLHAYCSPPGSEVRFQDAYPLLLASEASLSDLNVRLGPAKGPLPMNRFRPNLVVSAPAAWAEDAWAELQVGGMRFSNVKPCDRCSVPRTNQARKGDLGVGSEVQNRLQPCSHMATCLPGHGGGGPGRADRDAVQLPQRQGAGLGCSQVLQACSFPRREFGPGE